MRRARAARTILNAFDPQAEDSSGSEDQPRTATSGGSRIATSMLGDVNTWRDSFLLVTALLFILVLTPIVVSRPELAVIAAAAVISLAALRRPAGRLILFVVGAVFVYPMGGAGSVEKLIVVGLSIVSAVIALPPLLSAPRENWLAKFKPVVWGALFIIFGVVGFSAIPALMIANTDFTLWARDSLTYLLIALGVIVGLDGARDLRPVHARWLTLTFGAVTAFLFASYWIDRRGFGIEDVSREDLATVFVSLPALVVPIALAFALGLAGRRFNLFYVAFAFALIVAVVLTGTRTGLTLGFVLVLMLFRPQLERIALWKGLLIGAGSVALLVYLVPLLAAEVSSAEDVMRRIASVGDILGGSVANDRSGAIRQLSTGYALHYFIENPFFGLGPGFVYPNPNPSGADYFALDTPAIYLSKFGIVGCAFLAAGFVLIFIPLLRRPVARLGRIPLLETTVAWGSLLWAPLLVLNNVFENRGFPPAIALLVLLVASATRAALVGAKACPDDAAQPLLPTRDSAR